MDNEIFCQVYLFILNLKYFAIKLITYPYLNGEAIMRSLLSQIST